MAIRPSIINSNLRSIGLGLDIVCLTKGIKVGVLLRLDESGQIVNIFRQRIFGGWMVGFAGVGVVKAGGSLADCFPGTGAKGGEFCGNVSHWFGV